LQQDKKLDGEFINLGRSNSRLEPASPIGGYDVAPGIVAADRLVSELFRLSRAFDESRG
jgi:hypothetical protein